MKISIYTNEIWGGWKPQDYDAFLGGSEEIIVELSEQFKRRGHDVVVYYQGENTEYRGVDYKNYNEFKPWEYNNVFISWKNMQVWEQSIYAGKSIHYTAEINYIDDLLAINIDHVMCISDYHKRRMIETNPHLEDKIMTMYLGVPDCEVIFNVTKANRVLYSQAPERGLAKAVDLFNKYPKVKYKLDVTYGWDSYEKYNLHNPQAMLWRDSMCVAMDNDKRITQHGAVKQAVMNELYSKCKYWIHPLNNPDSELFCRNAVKAQLAGCVPVVNKVGALENTVNQYIEYKDFDFEQVVDVYTNLEFAKRFLWSNVIKEWERFLQSE